MAQALLIKTANTALKTVAGDIVGIFLDTHKFSDHEKKIFDITYIEGKREDVVAKLQSFQYDVKTAFKAATALWSLDRPERKQVWRDKDNKWYFLNSPPQCTYSMAPLSDVEKTILVTAKEEPERDAVFEKMIVDPGVWDDKNKVEVKDLNG